MTLGNPKLAPKSFQPKRSHHKGDPTSPPLSPQLTLLADKKVGRTQLLTDNGSHGMILTGSHRKWIWTGLLSLGMGIGWAGTAHSEGGPLAQARSEYEANHPFFNFTTIREWFMHPQGRTPPGMNGWGQPLRSPKLYTFFLNSSNVGPGPTQYSYREAWGSSMPLRVPNGPFAPAHAPVKALEFEKDVAEDK